MAASERLSIVLGWLLNQDRFLVFWGNVCVVVAGHGEE